MSTGTRRNDYHIRLVDCAECPARRGSRCRDEDGREMEHAHGSRVTASGIGTEKSVRENSVPCEKCGSAAGISCRGPYGNRLSRPHAARKQALAKLAAESG